jgi:hypothetical protein
MDSHSEPEPEQDQAELLLLPPPVPLPLIRSLSPQHVQLAIVEMLHKGKCILLAGHHWNYMAGGWTRWYVTRPDRRCRDTSAMRLVSVTTAPDGGVDVRSEEACRACTPKESQ